MPPLLLGVIKEEMSAAPTWSYPASCMVAAMPPLGAAHWPQAIPKPTPSHLPTIPKPSTAQGLVQPSVAGRSQQAEASRHNPFLLPQPSPPPRASPPPPTTLSPAAQRDHPVPRDQGGQETPFLFYTLGSSLVNALRSQCLGSCNTDLFFK